MRLDAAVDSYLDSLAAEGRSPRTIDAYLRDLALLVGALGAERGVGTITPADLLTFAASPSVRDLRLTPGPRHQTSVNRTRSAVRGLFDFLVRRLYRETRDLRRVQVALGHRSVGTTERYVAV